MFRTVPPVLWFVPLALSLAVLVARAQAPAAPAPTTGPATGPASAPAEPEPLVENPHYLAWARYKPGTRVEYEMNNTVNGMAMTTHVTLTLSELTPQQAVLQTAATLNVTGIAPREEVQTQVLPAQVPQSQARRAYVPVGITGQSNEIGRETIQAAGGSYDCTVVAFSGKNQGGESEGKMWRSPAVPGGLVKLESTAESPKMTVKMELKKVTEK